MYVISRQDWLLLQAAKAAGLTVEDIEAMDDPAPLPL